MILTAVYAPPLLSGAFDFNLMPFHDKTHDHLPLSATPQPT